MYELPTTVHVFDRTYKIRDKGDYRTIILINKTLSHPDFIEEEKAISALILFYDGLEDTDDVLNEFETPELLKEAIKQMQIFISCGEDNSVGYKINYKLYDWEKDEKLIMSSINPMLGQGQDIRAFKYMHWWTYISYFMGIKESPLSNVIGIREKLIKGKKLEKYEQEFRRDNPEYFNWQQLEKSQEEKDFENYIKDIWGNTL